MTDLFAELKLSAGEAALITSPYNMRYFSGFSGGEGYVLITKNHRYILVDSRYTGAAKEEAYNGFSVYEFNSQNPFSDMLRGFVFDNNIKSLVFEEDFVSVGAYNTLREILSGIELIPMSADINRARMIKTDSEVELIAHAEQIGVDAFNHALGYIKPGVTETEIAAELEYFMKKRGAWKTSFDTIVLSGARCALPHGVPGNNKIKNGDFVLMDFGCVYRGYCSDMTRTVAVGEVDKELKDIYEIVKAAQAAGLEAIKAGITGKTADRAARQVIEERGYGKYFGHSLGHGVGLQIHELPNLSPKSEIVLEENMIVSCEPGIYIYGFGGVRIEDLVCVKKDGIRNLTNLTRDLIVL